MNSAPTTPAIAEQPLLKRLSFLDRFLPVWILTAMVVGLLLGRLVPSVQNALNSVKVGQTSLPIALGLLLMMYPVLAKVRYEEMGHVTGDRRLLWLSLLLNWLIGPALMFTLAWVFLADQPAFRTGLIVIGLARCIAMVLIWNDLACGDGEAAALLVALNSVFQVLAYALLGTFYLKILPGWLGLSTQDVRFYLRNHQGCFDPSWDSTRRRIPHSSYRSTR
jgi:ACR3 family arsenite transporter